MSISYLTLEEILRIHFEVIEGFGGSHGVMDEGRLKSVANAPKQEVFGVEQYKTLYDKAAVYMRNIIGDHLFNDGNKRTAVSACAALLYINGIWINVDPKELEDFAVKVATDHLSVEEVSKWLQDHCINR